MSFLLAQWARKHRGRVPRVLRSSISTVAVATITAITTTITFTTASTSTTALLKGHLAAVCCRRLREGCWCCNM
jgi:hypothetical protein